MIKLKIESNINFKSLDKDISKNVNIALTKIGIKVSNEAKRAHQYQNGTGNLRAATTYWLNKSLSKLRVFIDEDKADYGKYIHNGFKGWSPDRFIDNAILKHRVWINKMVDKAVADAIKKWNRK